MSHELSKKLYVNFWLICKVNSVQAACAKWFAVHILKLKSFNHMKNWNKEHQTLTFQFFANRFIILMFFVSCGLQDFKF